MTKSRLAALVAENMITKARTRTDMVATLLADAGSHSALLELLDELIRDIDSLNPLEHAELNRSLAAAHRMQTANDLTRKIFGK